MKKILILFALFATIFALDYTVTFKATPNYAALRDPVTLQSLEELSWEQKGDLVVNYLQQLAEISQRSVKDLLLAKKQQFTSFWISNTIVISNPTHELLQELRSRPEVLSVEVAPTMFLTPTHLPRPANLSQTRIEWNVKQLKAPEAWQRGYKGQGVVVGIFDTGVYLHPDIKGKYRGGSSNHNYNWFDGVDQPNCKNAPCDENGHGTHVTGTVLGSNSNGYHVGVAPDAKWVACRAFKGGFATITAILKCFQWFLNPTDLDGKNPDTSKRPHITSNSWGGGRNTDIERANNALLAAGIATIFSAGNLGPRCSSMGYPGAFSNLLGVGALAHNSFNTIASFSSRGPLSGSTVIKPDVVAGGQNVVSCANSGTGYKSLSGTSMSCPGVSGAAALLLSRHSNLKGKPQDIFKKIRDTATPIRTKDCSSQKDHPNNVFGYGLVDALKLVS